MDSVPIFDGGNSREVWRSFCGRLGLLGGEARRQFEVRFPSVVWVPNRAQERPFRRWYRAPYPRTHVITFGNRTGKTEFLGEFLCGVTKGSRYVNPAWCDCDFFRALDVKRSSGTLTVWWVCDGEMMKLKAPDYKLIAKHIPDAVFKNKTNNGVYREIHIPTTGLDGSDVVNVVQVKTHDQASLAYAGENVDLIICDEPPPQEHWAEMGARTINLAGEMGGRILIGGTPLKMAAFLLDVIEESEDGGEAERGVVVHDEGSIWENCAGEELPEEIARRYGIERDPETGVWDTRGHLSREGIENAIKNWRKSGDPDEMDARVDGKFTHVQGRIYKVWNRDVHVIPDMPIPENWPVFMMCDPHDTRPDCAVFRPSS